MGNNVMIVQNYSLIALKAISTNLRVFLTIPNYSNNFIWNE